jgi:hypothetical protein
VPLIINELHTSAVRSCRKQYPTWIFFGCFPFFFRRKKGSQVLKTHDLNPEILLTALIETPDTDQVTDQVTDPHSAPTTSIPRTPQTSSSAPSQTNPTAASKSIA